jgi:UDP-3-O-[3-hydroxymyristoyl] glucosamine N-acyltransferase
MTETKSFSAAELAAEVGGKVIGDGSVTISRVASLEQAGAGDITYVEDEKFFDAAATSQATCVIVAPDARVTANCRIEARQPKLAFALIAGLLHPAKRREPAIHPTTVIAASASVDPTAYLGPHVVIEEHARVGAGTRIEAGVVIGAHVAIGSKCVLHPNVVLYDGVIGADGFGYVRSDMGYHKFPQIGTVHIEDDVELGAYTCVDRGALGRTRIGRGTKLDNLVHVGHNCNIGERVVIAAQTGISGSVTIEDDCVIGGQVGFGDHIHVQRGAVIGSKAGVLPGKIVRPGVWWGIPIQPLADYKRLNAHLGRLPQMRDEIKDLRTRLQKLEEKLARQ